MISSVSAEASDCSSASAAAVAAAAAAAAFAAAERVATWRQDGELDMRTNTQLAILKIELSLEQ